jgi:hypothetical protein
VASPHNFHVSLHNLALSAVHQYFVALEIQGGNFEKSRVKTDISASTAKPDFKKSSFLFTTNQDLSTVEEGLHIRVEVHSVVKGQGDNKSVTSLYAEGTYALSTILSRLLNGDVVPDTMVLSAPETGEAVGKLTLGLFMSEDVEGHLIEQMGKLKLAYPQPVENENDATVELIVHSALNLPASLDDGQPPSAFVSAKTTREAAERKPATATTHVSKKTRHPLWNECLTVNVPQGVLIEQDGSSLGLSITVVNHVTRKLISKLVLPLSLLKPGVQTPLDVLLDQGENSHLFMTVTLTENRHDTLQRYEKNKEAYRLEALVRSVRSSLPHRAQENIARLTLVSSRSRYQQALEKEVPQLETTWISVNGENTELNFVIEDRFGDTGSTPSNGVSSQPFWRRAFQFNTSNATVEDPESALCLELFQRGILPQGTDDASIPHRQLYDLRNDAISQLKGAPKWTFVGHAIIPLMQLKENSHLILRNLPLVVRHTGDQSNRESEPELFVEVKGWPGEEYAEELVAALDSVGLTDEEQDVWAMSTLLEAGIVDAPVFAPTPSRLDRQPLLPPPSQQSQPATSRTQPAITQRVRASSQDDAENGGTEEAQARGHQRSVPPPEGGATTQPLPPRAVSQNSAQPTNRTVPAYALQQATRNDTNNGNHQLEILVRDVEKKQVLIDRLMDEVDSRTVALRQAGEDIVELRTANNDLAAAMAEMERKAEMHKASEEKLVASSEMGELLDHDELLFKFKLMGQKYRIQSVQLAEMDTKYKKMRNDLIAKNELEKSYLELQNAHMAQGKAMQAISKENKKVTRYKQTAAYQEKVIRKLETLLEDAVKDARKAKDYEVEISELKNQLSHSKDNKEFEELKEAYERLRKRNTSNTSLQNVGADSKFQEMEIDRLKGEVARLRTKLQAIADGSGSSMGEEDKLRLEMKLESSETRVASLEEQLTEAGRIYARQITDLKAKLAEYEMGGGTTSSKLLLGERDERRPSSRELRPLNRGYSPRVN